MNTLSDVFDRLLEISKKLDDEEAFDVADLFDGSVHHRTVVYVRLPWPQLVETDAEVQERLARFLTSINRPDTIKCDVFTVIGDDVFVGYQPNTNAKALGVFDPDAVQEYLDDAEGAAPYVLQITVDVIKPAAVEATIEALKSE